MSATMEKILHTAMESLPNFPWSITPKNVLIASGLLLVPYVAVCRYYRYYWVRRQQKHFGFAPYGDRPLSSMSHSEAFEIDRVFALHEFFFTADLGMNMSLLSSYGDPEGSKLLAVTDLGGDSHTVSKRYADTGCIFTEFLEFPPGSPRFNAGIARMNYLHSRYGSKIKNHMFLYIGAAMIFKPINLVDKLEWRKTTEIERHARFLICTSILEGMGVKDVFKTPEEAEKFMHHYEANIMKKSDDTVLVGQNTLDMITKYCMFNFTVPLWEKLLVGFCTDPVRESLGKEKSPFLDVFFFKIFFPLRNIYLRNLTLPVFKRPYITSEERNEHGKYNFEPVVYTLDPWYVRRSLWMKISPYNILCWLKGWPTVYTPGYESEGYLPELCGPKQYRGKGLDYFREETERLDKKFGPLHEKKAPGRCPFADRF